MTRLAPLAPLVAVGALVAAFVPAPAVAQIDDERSSYSYVRTLEGRASLASAGQGPGEEATLHQPLMQGDVVRVERGARVEIALADRNLVRLAGDSTLVLARIAFSADRDDRTTRLDLDEGELLLMVTDDALGDELPEIRTPSGRVFVHQPGVYRLRVAAGGELELVVRSGYAELLTERGSSVVRAGEEAWAVGDRWSSIEIGPAGAADALERWSDQIDRQVQVASNRTLYVEPQFAYAAAPLATHGSWVYVDSTWCWRPRVTVDWRPYWNGRWASTPSGLTWVSYEPWGWLPYHYGTWTSAPGYGWVWRPGRVYSPAWVYWYVGPSWTGWCPIGYYADYYRSRWDHGFRFGLYGRAGGSWGLYADWNFCPTPRVFERDGRRWRHTGTHVGRLAGGRPPHGVLTTDTRHVRRRDWIEAGNGVVEKVVRGAGAYRVEQLAEVTDFVARKPNLSPEVERAVTVDRTRTVRRVDTPLGAATVRGKGGVDREADGIPAAAWRAKQGSADERAVAGRGRNAASPFPAPPTTSAGARRAAPQPVARPESRTSPALPNAAPGNGRSDHSDRGASGVREPGYVGGARAARPAAPTPAPDDRQGWRRSEPAARELGSDRRSPSARPATGKPAAVDRRGNVDGDAGDPPSYRRPDPRPQGTRVVEPSPGEPVRRVIGGVRRGSPAPTADSPRSAPPSVSPAPRAVPRATTPRPTYEAPRATPRPTYDAPRPTPRPTYDAPRPILRSPGQRTSPAPAPVDRTPRVTSPTSRSTRPTPHAVPTPRNAPAPRVIAPTTRNAPPPRVIVPTTRPTAPTVRTPSAPSSGSKATTTRGNSGTSQSRGGKSTAADPPRSSRAKGGGDKKGGDR